MQQHKQKQHLLTDEEIPPVVKITAQTRNENRVTATVSLVSPADLSQSEFETYEHPLQTVPDRRDKSIISDEL